MECKLPFPPSSWYASYEIIETYWNVNLSAVLECATEELEIIETYWNVNYSSRNAFIGWILEIIETYCNVNNK